MSSDYDISYSFTLNSPSPPDRDSAPVEEDLYAFGACEEFNLGEGAVLLVSLSRARQAVVTRDVAIALGHCREFRSLAGHARHLTQYMPELGGDEQGVQRVLESVRDNGLLESAADGAERLADAPRGAAAPPPSRVFLITCDRPDAVERLLESMLSGADLSRHRALFLVDDSREEGNAARNRELVQDFNLTSPVDMRYFGTAEREALIDALVERLPHNEDAVRFLLDRRRWNGHATYGLSRTVCLLLSVGCRAIMLDDDVLCRAIDSPYRSEGLQFFEGMSEADFYPGPEAWMRTPPRREDPLSGHLQCLGLGLGDTLDKLGLASPAPQRFEHSEERLLRRVGADSRVLVTQSGTFGDPGTGDTSWAFSLSGDSLARLLAGPASVEDKLTHRQYWMGWSRPTFSGRANMSQVTGLDNSAALPPYFPAWRGEDLLFGAFVEYLFPHAFVLNYPWAVPHLPTDERVGDATARADVAGGMSLVENHIAARRPEEYAPGPLERYPALVDILRTLGGSSDAELAATYRRELGRERADAVRNLGDLLRKAPADNAQWRAMLEERRRVYLQALGDGDVPVRIGGVPADMPEHAMWEHFRQLASGFAAALAAWPAMREAAAALDVNSAEPVP